MEFVGGGPSQLELGGHIAGPFMLARSDDVAVVVQAARAHSEGMHLFIEWVRRRQGQDAESWQTQQDQLYELAADYTDGPGGLSISAATFTSGRGSGPALTVGVANGGGGLASDNDQISGWFQLWITPPTPKLSIELTCSWIDLGLLPASRLIPQASMEAANARMDQLWPSDRPPPLDIAT